MATIDIKRFTKFRLQLELLASHTSYNPEDFVFYIVAYRYRMYGKEIVNYYEVCHKL